VRSGEPRRRFSLYSIYRAFARSPYERSGSAGAGTADLQRLGRAARNDRTDGRVVGLRPGAILVELGERLVDPFAECLVFGLRQTDTPGRHVVADSENLQLPIVLLRQRRQDRRVRGRRIGLTVDDRLRALGAGVEQHHGLAHLGVMLADVGLLAASAWPAQALADQVVYRLDAERIAGLHHDTARRRQIGAGEVDDLLAVGRDGIGRDDHVHLLLLEERLAGGRRHRNELDVF